MAQQRQSSPMSITQICNSTNELKDNSHSNSSNSLDDTDPDVRLAAEALGDMANGMKHFYGVLKEKEKKRELTHVVFLFSQEYDYNSNFNSHHTSTIINSSSISPFDYT